MRVTALNSGEPGTRAGQLCVCVFTELHQIPRDEQREGPLLVKIFAEMAVYTIIGKQIGSRQGPALLL